MKLDALGFILMYHELIFYAQQAHRALSKSILQRMRRTLYSEADVKAPLCLDLLHKLTPQGDVRDEAVRVVLLIVVFAEPSFWIRCPSF